MVDSAPNGFRFQTAGFSPNGRYLYYVKYNQARNSDYQLIRFDTRTKSERVLLAPRGRIADPQISPTGRYILFFTEDRFLVPKQYRKRMGKYGRRLLYDLKLKKIVPVDLELGAKRSSPFSNSYGFQFSSDESRLYFQTDRLFVGTLSLTEQQVPALVELTIPTLTYRLVGERMPDTGGESAFIEYHGSIPPHTRDSILISVWGAVDYKGDPAPEYTSLLYMPDGAEAPAPARGYSFYLFNPISGAISLSGIPQRTDADLLLTKGCSSPDGRISYQDGSWLRRELGSGSNLEAFPPILYDISNSTTSSPVLPEKFSGADECRLSTTGRYLTVLTRSKTLVKGRGKDNDLFRIDLTTGEFTPISTPVLGTLHDGQHTTREIAVSNDARLFAFTSESSRLVSGDRTVDDLFLVTVK